MSFDDEIEEYTGKETVTCEGCGRVNITKIKNISMRNKRGHIVYCDDVTWLKIKKASADYKTIGNYLAFLIKFFESHSEMFNTV